MGKTLFGRPKAPVLRLVMSEKEETLYRASLKGRARVLEFGAGGSTQVAMQEGVSSLLSVETDPAWAAMAAKTPGIAEGVADGRIKIKVYDIGPTGKFGRPTDESRRDAWPGYATSPWPHYADAAPDLVLVDGRFRVASAAQAALNCPPSTLIVIHDFWNRAIYHDVLPALDWRASADTMGVFTPRTGLNRAAAEAIYTRFAYDSR